MNKYHSTRSPDHSLFNHHERTVGFFVFIAFLIFLSFVVISVNNQRLFAKRILFYMNVTSSEGINHGSIVKVLGAEVGRVSNLALTQNQKIQITLEVYEDKQDLIRQGATAIVNRLTSLGNAQIEIKSVAMNVPPLAEGATIPVEETPSLNDLLLSIANLVQSADNNNLLSKIEKLLPKVEQSFTNLHDIIAQIASGKGVLGTAVFDQQVEQDLRIVVKSGANLLTDAGQMIQQAEQRLQQLEPILYDGGTLTSELKQASKDLPELIANLKQTFTLTQQALVLINAELQDIPGITAEARSSMKKAEQLLDSVQQTWPLSVGKIEVPEYPLMQPQPLYD